MTRPVIACFFALLISSLGLTGQENNSLSFKSFSSNTPVDNRHMTININQKGNEIFAQRSGHQITDDFDYINLMFIETDNVVIDSNGYFDVIDPIKRIWFIPFGFGMSPAEIKNEKIKFKYNCNCKGFPGLSSDGVCTAVISGDTIVCKFASGMSCFINEPGCRGASCFFDPSTNYFYNIYTTGVVVQADTVYIEEPNEFKPKPNNQPIEFIEDDNGNLYLRSDYEKMHGKKKD